MTKLIVPMMAMLASVAMPPASARDVLWIGPVQVTVSDGKNRALEYELIVPADLDDVWTALMTSDGLGTWAGPKGYVEPWRGGAWDVYFNPDAPKGQRGSENLLVAVVPGQMFIAEAGAPPQFPTVKAEKTIAIFEIEAVNDNNTLVRMTQTGWQDGEEWDAAFAYLTEANAEWLGWLHRRFTSGPLEWPEPPASDG